ncbi:branched-chain amino acid transaminase [Streptomyces mirabilis]|uniref:branched-chain amino acid transaminase n=1 Tax=Streptomyces mirabilis TaxID=68239 RepID=UPI003255D7DC
MVTLSRSKSIWMDGEFVPWDDARIHFLTPSLHYGWAVYEGMRAHRTADGTAVFRIDDHIARLRNSARVYMMEVPYSDEEVAEAIVSLVKENGSQPCYIRPNIYLGYGSMGVSLDLSAARVAIATWPWSDYVDRQALARGCRVMTSGWRRNHQDAIPPQAKATGAYINSCMAKIGAQRAGYDDALLLTDTGHVAECSAANFFLVKDGVLHTPPVSEGILPGITRSTVMTLAAEGGLEVVERRIARAEAYTADEIFLTGTAIGVVPVASVDDRPTTSEGCGPVTKTVVEAYEDATSGRLPGHADWCTPV